MSARQVLSRHAYLCLRSNGKLLPVAYHNLTDVPKKQLDSTYHTSHVNTFGAEALTKKRHTETDAFHIALSGDLGRLLSIDSRLELYQFLRRFTFTKVFYDEIHCLVYANNAQTDFQQVLNLVDMFTWNSGIEGLLMMKSCAETWYPDECVAHGRLLPHKTLCENINEPLTALSRLLDKASTDVWPKAVVLSQIELLLNKIISSGGQCTIDKVNQFLASNYCSELKGPLLCSSWVSFYLSPHQDDLKIAASILENNEHIMMPYLDRTLFQVAEHLLDERQLNRYYVLLQLFSKRSHQKKMENLLELLFNHFYNSNNFRGCSSCVSLACDLKLRLVPDLLFKFEVMKKGRNSEKDMAFLF